MIYDHINLFTYY